MNTHQLQFPDIVASASVLLVDDEPDIREVLGRFLRDIVGTIYVSSSGGGALDLLSERSVDMLIIDVILPDLDGFSLARQAREIHPELKILYMSGFAEATRHSPTRSGQAHFLAKPCRFQDVDRAVRALMAA